MKKPIRIISGFLGISMFMFGILKFVNPFKTWYTLQVEYSELPFPVLSYWAGQIGEIVVGGLFLALTFLNTDLREKRAGRLFLLGNITIIIMMLAAFYVHYNPNVPADVLPLKIRPPFIPGFFLVLALINIYSRVRMGQGGSTS